MTRTGQHAAPREASSWATGFAGFASIIMITLGSLHAIVGLVGLFNDEFFVRLSGYTFRLDVTEWGWVHLIGGAIIGAAGIAILSGRLWARAVGIAVAVLSAIANFLWLPYYPVWSIILIGLAVMVVWALTRYDAAALR